MNIFLTGHKGFIGQHLFRYLLAAGHNTYTDMRFFDTVRHDVVIHLAAKTHIRTEFDPALYESNILFAKKIMSTPYRLIYASSCSAAYMTNPYAYTKRFNEYLGGLHGNALGLRFHNVYGPGNNKGIVKFLLEQQDNASITIRGPQLIRDYVYVEDVVKMIVWIIESDLPASTRGVIDVGTGIGTRTIELVNLFQNVSGKRFVLDFGEHGHGEPGIMIANGIVDQPTLLRDGLKKTIDESHSN